MCQYLQDNSEEEDIRTLLDLQNHLRDCRIKLIEFFGCDLEEVKEVALDIIELYVINGGDDLHIDIYETKEGNYRLYLEYKDNPPSDELFRWTWWDQLISWWNKYLR